MKKQSKVIPFIPIIGIFLIIYHAITNKNEVSVIDRLSPTQLGLSGLVQAIALFIGYFAVILY